MEKLLSFILLSYFCLLSLVSSHSWMHCTDYDGTITGQDFDEDKCNGYIREWSSEWGATSFATDRGVNYFGSEGQWCQTSFSTPIADMYDDGYPYATWNVGETVTIVWPAKNHANYECFNFIPDTSMKIYYNSQANPTAELTGSVDSDWDLLIDFQEGCTAGTDGCGFQNCPDFCENTDGAPCFGEYEVSSDHFSTTGFYTIMWYWEFNAGSGIYTTCAEVYVNTGNDVTATDGTDTDTDTDTDTGTTNTDTDTTNTQTTNNDNNGNTDTDTDTTNNNNNDDDSTTNDNNNNDDTDSDTTNNNNNNDNNDDDDDDSDSGSGGGSVSLEYIVQIPICYTGGDYDKDSVIDGANAAFDDTNADVSFTIVSGTLYESNNGWNVTIQTHTDDAATVTGYAYDYSDNGDSDVCEEIEDEIGSGSCDICNPGSIRLYSLTIEVEDESRTSSSSGSSSDDGAATVILIVVIILVLILLLLIVGIGYYKLKEKKQNEKSASGNGWGQTNATQQNITYVQD